MDKCPHCNEPYQYTMEKYRKRHRKSCERHRTEQVQDREDYEAAEERKVLYREFVDRIELLVMARFDVMMDENLSPCNQVDRKPQLVQAKQDLYEFMDEHVELRSRHG
jgi:hypothetical protein